MAISRRNGASGRLRVKATVCSSTTHSVSASPLELAPEGSKATLKLAGETVPVIGYEIHAGVTETPADASQPMTLHCDDAVITDGLFSDDGLIFGTYLHGLFDEPAACNALLRWAGLQTDSAPDMQQLREHGIDRLADCLADHLNMEQLFALLASWEQQHAN